MSECHGFAYRLHVVIFSLDWDQETLNEFKDFSEMKFSLYIIGDFLSPWV